MLRAYYISRLPLPHQNKIIFRWRFIILRAQIIIYIRIVLLQMCVTK